MPCPPSRGIAPSFFSSPAAATPCTRPRRSASIICPPILAGAHVPEALFRDGKPQFVADVSRVVRGAHRIPRHPSAVLVPLAQMQNPLGVLIIGCEAAFARADDRGRVGRARVHARARAHACDRRSRPADQLGELLQAFSRNVSSTTLSAGLEMLCSGANRLFDADRTSVWLHDRRASMVVLSASSDVVYLAQERRIPRPTPSRLRRGLAPRARRDAAAGTTQAARPRRW